MPPRPPTESRRRPRRGDRAGTAARRPMHWHAARLRTRPTSRRSNGNGSPPDDAGISLQTCTMRRARGTRQDTTGSTRRAVHDVQRNKYSRRAAFTVRRADWGYSACLPRAIWVLTVPIGTLLCCEKRRAAPNAVLARDVHKMHVSNAQPLNTQQRRCSYGAQYRARCRVAFSMPPAIVARTHVLLLVPLSACTPTDAGAYLGPRALGWQRRLHLRRTPGRPGAIGLLSATVVASSRSLGRAPSLQDPPDPASPSGLPASELNCPGPGRRRRRLGRPQAASGRSLPSISIASQIHADATPSLSAVVETQSGGVKPHWQGPGPLCSRRRV